MKKSIIFLLTGLLCFGFNLPSKAQFDSGLAKCKIRGGTETLPRISKLDDNLVEIDEAAGTAEYEFAGSAENQGAEFDIEIDVGLSGINFDGFKFNKFFKTKTSDYSLIIEKFEDDREVAIISLNQDENMSFLETQAVTKISSIKNGLVSGIGKITYPRTVVISLDEFDLLDEGETDIELTDAVENGPVKVICKFKNVPLEE